MKNIITSFTMLVLALASFAAGVSAQADGKVELGYVVLDEEGSRAINQETFNSYEGFALSLTDWRWRHDNGTSVRANLKNMTLHNRNLNLGANRPGLYSFTFGHNQYRRTYSSDGGRYTKRRSTSGQVKVQPHRRVTVFGGMNYVEKKGQAEYSFGPASAAFTSLTDYTHNRFNIGSDLHCPYGFLRTEYRRFVLDDRTAGDIDRAANEFTAAAGGQVPRFDRVSVFGGYSYRDDQMASDEFGLTTNQLWASLRGRLPHNWQFDYRFLFARTDHSGSSVETDNWQNEFTIGRNWAGQGGFKVGYENRIVDDLINRTESNGIVMSGWYIFKRRLTARFRIVQRDKDVTTGTTLKGEEELTRHLLGLRYSLGEPGSASIKWRGRILKNDDIGSTTDYNSLAGEVSLRRSGYGRITAGLTYYVGQYENRSETVSYEFSDHRLTGSYFTPMYYNCELNVGGSYYRSRRDQDIEKFDVFFGVRCTAIEHYELRGTYQAFNFDDFLVNGSYYTANVVELSLIRNISL